MIWLVLVALLVGAWFGACWVADRRITRAEHTTARHRRTGGTRR